jgi:hypothetical protein
LDIVHSILLGVVNMEITEALAIELTKNCLINGQDEKPLNFKYWPYHETVTVTLSDGRVKIFNRVEVEHARLMLKSRGEKK